MDLVETAQINSFAPIAEQTNFPVLPSEEAVFILTASQLKYLIKEAIQPLQDEVMQLRATATAQEGKIAALESTQDTHAENSLIQLRLIGQLREAIKKNPQPMQRDRGEILRALIAANGGKMLATDARKKMHLSRPLFTALLATVQDEIDARPYHLNKSWKVLVLR